MESPGGIRALHRIRICQYANRGSMLPEALEGQPLPSSNPNPIGWSKPSAARAPNRETIDADVTRVSENRVSIYIEILVRAPMDAPLARRQERRE